MTKRKQEAAQGLQSIMFLHPFASVRPLTAEERQAVVEDGRWRRNRQWWRTGGGGGGQGAFHPSFQLLLAEALLIRELCLSAAARR